MIRAICSTNLDKYRNRNWPKKFAAVPRKGDFVEAVAGHDQLEVLYVVHCIDVDIHGSEPFIRVMLGKRYTH